MALDYMLRLFATIMEGLDVFPERMMANLNMTRGLIFSERVLLALVESGMVRNDAYLIVQASGEAGLGRRGRPSDASWRPIRASPSA